MLSVIERVLNLFYPPRCCACRQLLAADEKGLCRPCNESYLATRDRTCPLCLKVYSDCDCPNRYMERNRLHTLVKLYRYQPRTEALTENRLIFRLKETDNITVPAFLAGEMAPCIKRHMKSNQEYVLVGVPRSRKAIRKYGGDHIALLCRELSGHLSVPYIPAVRRVGSETPQKSKNRRERIASAGMSYEPRKRCDLKGKTVILVDDIVTTGASMVACAKVLRKMGARGILCAAVGVTFRYEDLIGNAIYAERRRLYGM